MACANGVSALTLPWTNVTVQANSNVQVRGVSFGVGTPPQTLSLWPSFGDNVTWVPNSLDCNNDLSNLSCIAVDGGIYVTSNSSTYKFAPQSSWNGSQTLDGIHTYLNDDAQVASDDTIWGMPLVQHNVNLDIRSALGLGADSSFLKSLVSQNLAPSRNFGLWSGSQSVDNPIDGSLVVGGFDSSKVGTLTNFSSIPGCVACAVVTGFEVTSSNGKTSSLLNATVPQFKITIDPYYTVGAIPVLSIPDEIRDMLVDATQSIWLPDDGVYGWRNGQQPGDVKVTLSNGYQVTIPGNEIWLPPRAVNSAGQSVIRNNTEILNSLRASGKFVSTTSYVWGQPFLSANYMIVWPDDGIWSLSPISRAQKSASSSVQNLCGDATPSAPSPSTSDTSDTDTGSSSGSNAGAIAGGVVGGVLGLALLLAAFWFFRRRSKRRSNNYHPAGTELQNTDADNRRPDDKASFSSKKPWVYQSHTDATNFRPELAANDDAWRMPAEMPGSPNRVVELPDNQRR